MKRSPHSEETKEKMRGPRIPRETRICACGCNETFECKVNSKRKFIKGHNGKFNKNIKHSKEYKEHCRISQQKLWQNPEYREMQSRSHRGYMPSEETKKKCRKCRIRMWADPEYREKQLRAIFEGCRIKPNKPEKFLDKLLQRLLPNEYRYVGDGQFILAGKCPDFVNVNGQKKIIELFGDYWHGKEKTGIPNKQHERGRIDLFAQYGYQTLIIWEHELSDTDNTIDRIMEFNNARNH